MTERFGTRALAFIALTIILASILGFAVYQFRPPAKAVATIALSNGALEELVSGLIPDFKYSPPTAESVAAWLDDRAAGSTKTVSLDSNELVISVWDEDADQAALSTQQLATSAVVYFDADRRDLMQDVDRWFETKLAAQDDVLPIRLSSDEQHLIAMFKVALIAAEAEACSQDAMRREDAHPATVDVKEGKLPEDGSLLAVSDSHQQPLIAIGRCDSVKDDLNKLRTMSRADNDSFVLAQTMRSTLIEQRASLVTSEAWAQPAAWIRDPAGTAERPAWARLHFLIPGSIVLSMLVSLLIISLFSALACLGRGQVVMDEDDQIINNPYWPARLPERTLEDHTVTQGPRT